MLQSLEDIQVFTKLLDEGKISSDMNQLDSNYLKLNTTITPLDKKSDTYKLLVEYVENTHAVTHTAYKLSVDEIFEVKKDVEEARYRKDISNKQLLWHGSRLTNFVGILSQGLRIAPPEAPVTGYMFGKGVYFADMVTKSANYCFTSRENNTGLMLLCEVALGG
jgi:poly [ADP-ribose] polymerase